MKLRGLIVFALFVAACSGNVFDLEVGQCFDDPESTDEVTNVEIVECSEPHDNEVFATFDLPEGDYPGLDSVETSAAEGCVAAFEPYVGATYETSSLDVGYLYPTAETWDGGDREIVCLLFDTSGTQLTSSVQGSGL